MEFMKFTITLLMAWAISSHMPHTINSGETVVITEDIDLQGQTMDLPSDVKLSFQGGVIKNGTIIGDETRIDCQSVAFDNVSIKGSWDVSVIYSSWFRSLDNVNALREVFAMTSPDRDNKVIISEGEYSVAVYKASESCLEIGSNTQVQLDGTIKMLQNHYSGCNVVSISGCNVSLDGKGAIIGDKDSHLGTKGEWGMGINVSNAKDIHISGITVKDCWGDCIYIGKESEDVTVDSCTLENGRRQGISVTSATDVTIRNVIIKNIGGTAPGYAIDIEPNKDERIDNVLIDGINASDCEGGIFSTGHAVNAFIGSIIIKNCTIENTTKMPIRMEKCSSVSISGCKISNYPTLTAIRCNNVDSVDIRHNTILDINKSDSDKRQAYEGKRHIQAFHSKSSRISNNRIF